MSNLPSLAKLREKATKLGIDPQPYGKSRRKLQAAIAQSELASKALKSKTAGAMSWGKALKSKPKRELPKSKLKARPEPAGHRSLPKKRRKSIKTVMDAHNYVCKKKPKVEEAPKVEGVPQGMKRVKYPKGYDPNNPKPRGNNFGPRMMMCGHNEWWWCKAEKKCLACYPKNHWRKS